MKAFNVTGLGLYCSDDEVAYWHAKFNFNIIDQVKVPSDLPPGDYLLSWRWDAEQTYAHTHHTPAIQRPTAHGSHSGPCAVYLSTRFPLPPLPRSSQRVVFGGAGCS